MATRDRVAIPIAFASILSSSTSTSSIASVDLGPYFNVGRREVKFAVALTSLSTLTTTASVTLWQSDTASTANSTVSMTAILGYDGSTGTWTSTADTSVAFEWNGIVTKRYITARYIASTSTGSTWAVAVFALPQVRAG